MGAGERFRYLGFKMIVLRFVTFTLLITWYISLVSLSFIFCLMWYLFSKSKVNTYYVSSNAVLTSSTSQQFFASLPSVHPIQCSVVRVFPPLILFSRSLGYCLFVVSKHFSIALFIYYTWWFMIFLPFVFFWLLLPICFFLQRLILRLGTLFSSNCPDFLLGHLLLLYKEITAKLTKCESICFECH